MNRPQHRIPLSLAESLGILSECSDVFLERLQQHKYSGLMLWTLP